MRKDKKKREISRDREQKWEREIKRERDKERDRDYEIERDECISRKERGKNGKGKEEFQVCLIKIISDTILSRVKNLISILLKLKYSDTYI